MKLARTLLAATAAACLLAPLAAAPAFAQAAPAAEAPAVRTIDRGRFTVEVSGQGPDVILIPGLISSRTVWDEVMDDLSGYRVHRVQIAGFAGLPAGPNAQGEVVAPVTAELARYIEDEKLEKPAVIGHSMGGLWGLLLAQARPELVGRLMIVDAAPFIGAMGNPSMTVEQARPMAERFRDMVTGMDDKAFAAGQQGTAASMVRTEARRPLMVDWSLKSDRGVMARAVHDVMTTDARPGLPAMATPVTVLYAWDQAMGVPPERMDAIYGDLYAPLPGVKLVRVDQAFHFLMWDQPERFAAEVKAFVKD